MKAKRLKNVAIGCLAAGMALFSGAGVMALQKEATSAEVGGSEAYFLTEDRYTQGFWYNGANGLKDNPDRDRNYGNDGLVLFFHWLRENGQQCMDVEKLNDFTNDPGYYPDGEKVNYVEYPSYVSSIEGNITSIGKDPFTYWMNTPKTMTESLKQSQNGIQPLPIEGVYHDGTEFTWSHGGFECAAGGTTEFTVEITDEEWHTVTYYAGNPWRHKYFGYDAQWMKIYDLSGNLLAQHLIDDVNQGVHVRFAVKGSFVIQYYGSALSAFSNGIFFDEYEENTEIGTQDLTAELEGSKIVNLAWQNKSDATYTSVYRRKKGEKLWDFIAEIEPGVNTYTDTSALVSTTYEYALASATEKKRDPDYIYANVKNSFIQPQVRVKTYNLPDFDHLSEVSTAAYNKTAIEYEENAYAADKNERFTVRARLTKADENGENYQPYAGVEMSFTLEGDSVYTDLGVNKYPNMNPLLGKATTDENGYAEISGSVEFAGEYRLIASIEPQPDAEDPMFGYDSSFSQALLSIREEEKNPATPFLLSISDAVKPGETVTLTGYRLADDGELKIAYAKNEGGYPGAYSEERRFYYVEKQDILFVDSANGTGIMFTLPEYTPAGAYDFYVHNASGWSNGITLNAARPLYLDQEGAYAGQEIQIVGRNFLQNEYGVGDLASALSALKVKLTQVKDGKGNAVTGMSYTLTAKNGGILTGNKVTKENAMQFENDSLQAEDIPYTYSLRITIKIPEVYSYGTYEVTVAADGKDFRALSDNCKLVLHEKKAQNWDKTVFGEYSVAHIGNDPLDLGVWWAQDLNYTNVITMDPAAANNTFDTAKAFTDDLNAKIKNLSRNGGVVYFPAGEYYLTNDVMMLDGVILVGAGEETKLYYCNNMQTNTIWFRSAKASRIGIARMTLDSKDARLQTANGWYAPKYIVKWDGNGTYDQDTTLSTVTDRFLTQIKGELYGGETVQADQCQRLISITGKNCVLKDSVYNGGMVYTELNSYGSIWNVKFDFEGAVEMSPHWNGRYLFLENSYFDMHGMGHGPSVKSNQYIAYTFTAHTGNRKSPTNDGEALLMEAPSGTFSVGKVLDSSARTISLDFTGGVKILANTAIRFNMCAVYISDGTGAGQYRYIKTAGTGAYANCYELMDWERDWDILPDSTSVFSCIAPLANMTIYHYKAYDCVSSICIYSNHMDTVVDGCTLVDTAGITGGGLASGGMSGGRLNPMTNVRIVNNDISGVGSHAKQGLPAASVAQSGGIQIYSGGSGDYMGLLTMGITIRNNYLHDLIPAKTEAGAKPTLGSGLILYFKGGQNSNANGMRYIVAENNVVENSEWGIRVDREMTGVVMRNNYVSGATAADTEITVNRAVGFYGAAEHELYINGEKSELSGEYEFESLLPEAPSSGEKVFLGWTEDKEYSTSSEIVTRAYGKNVTLYAVYGYKVTFDYNYLKSDGSARGEFASFKTHAGGSIAAQLAVYGEPIRVGYKFGGWYTDEACTEAFDTNGAIGASGKVYAKWIDENTKPADESSQEEEKKGCGASVSAGIALSGIVALCACAIFAKKKNV